MVTFVEGITFHTASLHWIAQGYDGGMGISINGRYEIALGRVSELGDSLDGNMTLIEPIFGTVGRHEYALRLIRLAEDTVYKYSISLVTDGKKLEGPASEGIFRTLRYRKFDSRRKEYLMSDDGLDRTKILQPQCISISFTFFTY